MCRCVKYALRKGKPIDRIGKARGGKKIQLRLAFTIFESVTFFGTIHDAHESNGGVEILAIGNA